MTFGPYKIDTATLDPATGEGEAVFADKERLLFTVRTYRGRRLYRLLSPRYRTGISCPPRFKSVVGWVGQNFSDETIIAAR